MWESLGVAALNTAGKLGAAPAMAPLKGGDVSTFTDHSNWSVNFGNGASVGGVSSAPAGAVGLVVVGVIVWLLVRKAK
jgi:hypothetical protein